MSTVYDASMGVRVSKSDTDGWTYQYWWNNDYTWRKLAEGSTEMLSDVSRDTLSRLPDDLRKDLLIAINEILKDRGEAAEVAVVVSSETVTVPSTDKPKLTAEQITEAHAEIKAKFAEKDNQIEVKTVEEFLNNLGPSWVIVDALGEVESPDTVAMALRVHGVYIFEAHFPDGDKYEVVIRHRTETDQVRTFTYKL